jgi:gliding motility-associated lipoprotein GldH
MIKIIPLLCVLSVLSFLFVSCNKSEVYNKFDDGFTENRWQKNDVRTYEFTIDDTTKLYNITFRFSHVYDYQFNSVPIHFTIVNPQGEEQKKRIDLQIKDAAGKELAECSVDFCDLNYMLQQKVQLQKGTYKIIVSHSFEGPYLPNILGIGLKVEEDKKGDTVRGGKR